MGGCLTSEGKKRKFIDSQAKVTDLKATYDIGEVLGAGSFGKVFFAKDKMNEKFELAIKCINKKHLDKEELENLQNEVKLMQQVDHPNIVRYYETYDDKKFLYLCMELCNGGELLSKMEKDSMYNEPKAAEIMNKLFRALNHCHADNIIHRDIKPENIMWGNDGEVKLIDFGFAIKMQLKKARMDIAGTPYYIAPEVLNGVYGKECDTWSTGVVLYQMMTGLRPFDGNSQEEVFGLIQAGDYKFPKQPELSEQVKDLITRMLIVDPAKRITVAAALKHPWFGTNLTKSFHAKGQLQSQQSMIMKNLSQNKRSSTLKTAAINILVKHLSKKEVADLRAQFESIDTDGSGYIELSELRAAMERAGNPQTEADLKSLIETLDYAQNDKINYTEFIAATLDVKSIISKDEKKLLGIFNTFDVDNTGYISKENMKVAFSKYGREITDDEIINVLKQHDKAQNDRIDFTEFKQMLEEDFM